MKTSKKTRSPPVFKALPILGHQICGPRKVPMEEYIEVSTPTWKAKVTLGQRRRIQTRAMLADSMMGTKVQGTVHSHWRFSDPM
jgi:hypothetical protein